GDRPDAAAATPRWSVGHVGDQLRVAYGSGAHFPQCAVLHLDSSYFRLAPPGATWGSSVVTLPALWSGGRYHQGGPVAATWHTHGDALVLCTSGAVGPVSGPLRVAATIALAPPGRRRISATVAVRVAGAVALDHR